MEFKKYKKTSYIEVREITQEEIDKGLDFDIKKAYKYYENNPKAGDILAKYTGFDIDNTKYFIMNAEFFHTNYKEYKKTKPKKNKGMDIETYIPKKIRIKFSKNIYDLIKYEKEYEKELYERLKGKYKEK